MEQTKAVAPMATKNFFAQDNVKKKFDELMGKRAPQFITSILQIVSSNELLQKADPLSIYNAAAVAATLDLPLNNSLGFAYIVPYNVKQRDGSSKCAAQFQIGYKGFIQLAQRSGQFKTISAAAVYEGQLVEMDPLRGFRFDFSKKKSDKVIGYASFFALTNGFEKIYYMTVDDIKKHAGKYSQTYKKNFGVWKDDFDGMACKTVTKLLLSKYAPLSIEMQKSMITDQAIIKDEEGNRVEYTDHEEVKIDKEEERVLLMLDDCKTEKDVKTLFAEVSAKREISEELDQKFAIKLDELRNAGK